MKRMTDEELADKVGATIYVENPVARWQERAHIWAEEAQRARAREARLEMALAKVASGLYTEAELKLIAQVALEDT